MKKKFFCPVCGICDLSKMFITTSKGKSLSLLLSSQADLRKSSGEVSCDVCKQVWLLRKEDSEI